jgi:hypothetical protein
MVVALVPRAHIFSPGNALACFTQATNCDRRIAVALRDLRIADVERRIPVDRDRAKQGMKRILITGMSGTGKSSAIQELAARGYQAHDLDTPEWSEWVDADPADTLTPQGKDRVWRGDRIRALLSRPGEGTLFIASCAENMARLFPLIDVVILLSAPVATIMERLRA